MAFTLAKIEESQAEEMIIPDSVKEILSNTFLKLPNLKKVTFGKNVNVIENKFGFVKRNIKARIFCVLFLRLYLEGDARVCMDTAQPIGGDGLRSKFHLLHSTRQGSKIQEKSKKIMRYVQSLAFCHAFSISAYYYRKIKKGKKKKCQN